MVKPAGDDEQIVTIAEPGENIFAKMNVPDAELQREKSELVLAIDRILEERHLTQAAAAAAAGIAPADMSRILRGRLENYSITRLEHILKMLGMSITKVIAPTTRPDGRGMTSVSFPEANASGDTAASDE